MKIILLTDSLGFGGAQRQIANLAVELKALGHEIIFACYQKDNFYLSLLQKAQIVPAMIESTGVISRLKGIRRFIRKNAPDVVISFGNTPNFCACVAAIGKHKWKTIISERIAKHSVFHGKKAALMKRVQALYADAIVCNSKCAQDLWQQYYPQTADKLTTIYNIIDVPQIQKQLLQNEKCRLLIAARYEPVKNLDGLLKAVLLLTEEEKKNLEIHWYGNENVFSKGESVLQLGKAFVEENMLGTTVFLHPATDRIYAEMANSDFIALFSHAEGLPNAILEGMSLKKPVIMSKVSDYAVLVDETNGFCCDPNSAEEIAASIRAALNTTPQQRNAMGQCSYEKVQKVCSREAVVDRWCQLINNLRK